MKIEELIGTHIFDGTIDYRINGYSYPNIYAEELEYDESSDEFWKTGRNIVLRSSEVERDYKNDYGTEIKIVWQLFFIRKKTTSAYRVPSRKPTVLTYYGGKNGKIYECTYGTILDSPGYHSRIRNIQR